MGVIPLAAFYRRFDNGCRILLHHDGKQERRPSMPPRRRRAAVSDQDHVHQREALISCTRLKGKFKDRLKDAPEGTQVIGFSKKELDHIEIPPVT